MDRLLSAASRLAWVLTALVAGFAAAHPGGASHTTRVNELQDEGLDPWLLAIAFCGIAILLTAFAVAILIWEHAGDEEQG